MAPAERPSSMDFFTGGWSPGSERRKRGAEGSTPRFPAKAQMMEVPPGRGVDLEGFSNPYMISGTGGLHGWFPCACRVRVEDGGSGLHARSASRSSTVLRTLGHQISGGHAVGAIIGTVNILGKKAHDGTRGHPREGRPRISLPPGKTPLIIATGRLIR